MSFVARETLLHGRADPRCRAVVALPARNEEQSLAATLDALAGQVDLSGRPLRTESYEVLLLLNNCTDASAAVAGAWRRAHPEVVLHCCERELATEVAHIGTARRLLMDTAWERLQGRHETCVILSTDSDSYPARNWIAENLRALDDGADAVGGVIELIESDYEALPLGVRRAYRNDRRYQYLIAEMEDWFDPQVGDPWPRHLEHFGASLGCTPEVYARAGGMPRLPELEDVAFVDRLRQVDARLRHEPKVVVYTSARLDGRIATGLSGQLRCWQTMHDEGRVHRVLSAEWLRHRFATLCRLRQFHATGEVTYLAAFPMDWKARIGAARDRCGGVGEFLAATDCDRLMEETFGEDREGEIEEVNRAISRVMEQERAEAGETMLRMEMSAGD